MCEQIFIVIYSDLLLSLWSECVVSLCLLMEDESVKNEDFFCGRLMETYRYAGEQVGSTQ